MSKTLKETITRDLDQRFGSGQDVSRRNFVAVNYVGLDSVETFDLRRSLREFGSSLHVVPNRLMKRVIAASLSEDGNALLEGMFKGPTALVIGDGEGADSVIKTAKAVSEWKKKHKDKLAIKGGLLEGVLLEVSSVEELARIPDIKALHGQIANLFQAPLRGLAVATQQIVGRVVYALQAIKDKKEQE